MFKFLAIYASKIYSFFWKSVLISIFMGIFICASNFGLHIYLDNCLPLFMEPVQGSKSNDCYCQICIWTRKWSLFKLYIIFFRWATNLKEKGTKGARAFLISFFGFVLWELFFLKKYYSFFFDSLGIPIPIIIKEAEEPNVVVGGGDWGVQGGKV